MKMNILARIAERKIDEAIARGELDDLPGAGRPLPLEADDPFVPSELRMAYRMLKNAGFLPPEVELRREIHSLSELLACVDGAWERREISGRLQVLMLRLAALRPHAPLHLEAGYRCRINRRFRESAPNRDP